MADKKKEEPLADKYSLMSTNDLLKEIEKWNADTKDAAKKREKADQDVIKQFKKLEEIETNYILKKRGVKSIDDLTGPLGLDKDKRKEEATELINNMLLESIKKEYGKDAAKLYEKNPDMLQGYAAAKGINWHETRKELMDNYKDLRHADRHYRNLKSVLAEGTVKEKLHIQKVEREITDDVIHHKETRKRANNFYQKNHKYTIDDTVDIQEVLGHYSSGLKGDVNSDYLLAKNHETHFKPYNKK